MSTQKQQSKKPKLTVAQLEAKLTATETELDSTRKHLSEQSLELYSARSENSRLRTTIRFLRGDRAALVGALKVLGQEADIAEGRSVRDDGSSRVSNAKEAVQ